MKPAEEAKIAGAMRRGTPLVLAGHLASQLIGLGTLAVLYRLLDPSHYGILGAVLPAVMLPRMAATLGPGIAVMQRKELSATQLSILFWIQVCAGFSATATTAVIGWLMATYYEQPILFPVATALGGGTLFAALGNQHQALLERDFRFGTGSLLRLAAQVVACAGAIIWACYRADVWALVLLHVVELMALCGGSWLLVAWRPTWPARPWRIREVVHFSAAYSGSSLLYFVTQNMEKIVFPIFFGEAGNRALGLYSQAFGLMIKPVYLLTTPLTGVMVSSLAQAPLGSELYASLTTKFFRVAALGLFPCAVGLTLVSEEVTLLLGGPSWRDAAPLLRWLAPSLAAIGFVNLATLMLASRGQGRVLLFAFAWLLVLTVQAAIAGMFAGQQWLAAGAKDPYAASVGLAAAFTLLQFLAWTGPFLWFALRSVGLNPLEIWRAVWPALWAAAVMGLIVWGMQYGLSQARIQSPAVRVPLLVLTGIIAFSSLALRELIWVQREWLPRAPLSMTGPTPPGKR